MTINCDMCKFTPVEAKYIKSGNKLDFYIRASTDREIPAGYFRIYLQQVGCEPSILGTPVDLLEPSSGYLIAYVGESTYDNTLTIVANTSNIIPSGAQLLMQGSAVVE